MKKLTKTLSLVLVIAMIVSLCVVGVSAKTFSKDGDKINENYKEAVDVMSGIGIISGTDTAGTTFNPTGNFTRAAAAKIIAYMQLGVTAAEALKGTANTFKDVPATSWAAPYIAYCAQMKIINGYGNGNFGPDDSLTGYAWAKMLLCAVGYGAKSEYTGSSWAINVAKDALSKGVFTNVLSASTPEVITREQATQMAFNTLTGVKTVTYSSLLGDYIDASTTISGVSTKGTLGTTVYKLAAHDKNNAAGLTGHVWYVDTYKPVNVVSGWYQDDTVALSWTDDHTAATDTTVETALSGYTFNNTYYGTGSTGMNKYVNGVASNMTLSAANIKALTANGTKVEVVVNSDNEIVKVVVTETVLAKITAKDVDNKTVTVSDGTNSVTLKSTSDTTAYGDAYTALYAKSVDDQVLLVEQTSGTAISAILSYTDPTTVSGQYTAASATAGTKTVGDKAYGESAYGDFSAVSTLGNYYTLVLDTYGYVMAAKTATGSTTYAYMLQGSKDGTAMAGYTYSAQLLFADGTMKWVTIASWDNSTVAADLDSAATTKDHTFVAYTVGTDGGYALTEVPNTAQETLRNVQITKNSPTLNGKTASNSTVFLVYNTTSKAYDVYTGIKNVPTMTVANTATTDGTGLHSNGVYKMVVVNKVSGVMSTDAVYVYGASTGSTYSASGTIYTYPAIVNGVKGTVQVLTNGSLAAGLYVGNTYTNGVITATGSYSVTATTGAATFGTTQANTIQNCATTHATAITLADGVLAVDSIKGVAADNFVCYLVNTTSSGSCATKTLSSTAFNPTAAGHVYFAIDASGYVAYAIIVDTF